MDADTRAKIALLCRMGYLSDEAIARYVAAPHEGVSAYAVSQIRKTSSGNVNTGKGRSRSFIVRECEDTGTLEYEQRRKRAKVSSARMLKKLVEYSGGYSNAPR